MSYPVLFFASLSTRRNSSAYNAIPVISGSDIDSASRARAKSSARLSHTERSACVMQCADIEASAFFFFLLFIYIRLFVDFFFLFCSFRPPFVCPCSSAVQVYLLLLFFFFFWTKKEMRIGTKKSLINEMCACAVCVCLWIDERSWKE